MSPEYNRIFIFLACMVLLGGYAQSQVTPSLKSMLREIDSVNALKYREHRRTVTSQPLFPQRSVGIEKKRATRIASAKSSAIISPQLTICYDTSGRFFLTNDSITLYVSASKLSKDGKIWATGEFADWRTPNRIGGYLLKCNDSGVVDMLKLYDTVPGKVNYNISYYYQLLELQDGTIVIAGHTNDYSTENDDVSLLRISSTGDLLWNRTFKSRVWTNGNGSADYFWIKDLKQDPASGDLYMTAAHWAQGTNITRFRLSDGNIVWSNLYDMSFSSSSSFHSPFGLDLSSHELIAFTKISSTIMSIWRLSKATGDTIETKFFRIIDNSGFGVGFVTTEGMTKLDNGHYAIYGRQMRNFYWPPGGSDSLYHVGVVEFDADFKFIRADSYQNNVESNGFNTRVNVFPDGSGFYSMLNYISGYTADIYYIQFKEGQILKQRVRRYFGEGSPSENQAIRMPDGGDMVIKLLGDSINNFNKVEFLNLHLSDTSSNCLGFNTVNNYTTPYYLVPLFYDKVVVSRDDLFLSRQKTFSTEDLPTLFLPGCQQISNCDTLSLVPSSDSFCIATPVSIVFRKNPACGATPFIKYDTSMVQSFRILNDSTFQFIFKKPGRTSVSGSIFGCTLVVDSVSLNVFQSPGSLSIGPDSVICPGNSIRLSAKKGYKAYRWQDGSTDSVFTVMQPGEYWVIATDSCGNLFSDTMMVAPHPPIPFDIGPDVRICEKDTVSITAPASFINYQWTPNYNIINRLSQTVSVFPQRDTMYKVQAEKTPGCFVYDSIKVFVNAAPPINLGLDKSFCSGDSAVLNAGPGFTQYIWNTRSINQQITVYNAGLYIVDAKTFEGCSSKDSLKILNVFTNPVVNLGFDSVICVGTNRQLNAGNFSSYNWNNGAITSSILIDRTGRYAVTVTDNNGCKGSDTLDVTKAILPPASFLPTDTTICTYAKFELGTSMVFNSYTWNTGGRNSSITVSKPGQYWLEVKDKDNCIGRDSIMVFGKDCLKGFFAPNAFTPNSDGKNDSFRPLIFGVLSKYDFRIYNRWGQMVFQTSDYSKAWDGGYRPLAGGYTWICTYQLENEKSITEKGSVLLIR